MTSGRGLCGVVLGVCLMSHVLSAGDRDPYLWLEEVDGEAALQWVDARNAESTAVLEKVPEFAAIHARSLEILNSRERIPSVSIRGAHLYNLWQDADNPRGLWRRTSLAEFKKAEPQWELVLDIDALGRAEGESWVAKDFQCLEPEYRHCLISLSRGGGDAVVVREFDTVSKTFVDDGFVLPEAKSRVDWRDENSIWVGTDFGDGSLTSSGYPRLLKLWRRGTPLSAAPQLFQGAADDVSVGAYSVHSPEGRYDVVYRVPEFFRGEYFLVLGDRLVKLDIPVDAELQGFFKDHLLLTLRTPWQPAATSFPADALLAIDLDDFLAGKRDFEVLFEPAERLAFDSVSHTRDRLLLATLDNVRGRLEMLELSDSGWTRQPVALPGPGQASISTAARDADLFFFSYEDFLTPDSLWLVAGAAAPVRLKSLPQLFDATGMAVEQFAATSADGTVVPYFAVFPQGFAEGRAFPTLLYGYGGFEVTYPPFYSGVWGSAWLERGGVVVMANIRGGGEFGPSWHQAAVKGKRHKSYEDFIAVAEDLVARGITSPGKLGIMGGSNGGLLVGAVTMMRPDLFAAVVCQAPLLDMQRYHKLLAGASWMAEYGDPDTAEDWQFIRRWSPYHNIDSEADYPRVLFTTSTRDDRVHPGHARKMAARMLELGKPVFFYENTEGGHAGAADNTQKAYMSALEMSYLWMMLR